MVRMARRAQAGEVEGDGHEDSERQWGKYIDDRSGKPLRSDLVTRARR